MLLVVKTLELPKLRKNFTHQAVIKNKRVPFDASGTGSLQSNIDFYGEKFKYIGTGTIVSIDGVEQYDTEIHHFFKRRLKAWKP